MRACYQFMNAAAPGLNPVSFDDRELFDFSPSAARAKFLDDRMRSRLADSLGHVFEQTRDAFSHNRSQCKRESGNCTVSAVRLVKAI